MYREATRCYPEGDADGVVLLRCPAFPRCRRMKQLLQCLREREREREREVLRSTINLMLKRNNDQLRLLPPTMYCTPVHNYMMIMS